MSASILWPLIVELRQQHTPGTPTPTGEADCPPHGLLQVTRTTRTADGVLLYEVQRPADVTQQFVVNSPVRLGKDRRGQARAESPVVVAYDPADGTPAAGEVWGPRPGSFLLRKGGAGFVVFGPGTTVDTVVCTRQVAGGESAFQPTQLGVMLDNYTAQLLDWGDPTDGHGAQSVFPTLFAIARRVPLPGRTLEDYALNVTMVNQGSFAAPFPERYPGQGLFDSGVDLTNCIVSLHSREKLTHGPYDVPLNQRAYALATFADPLQALACLTGYDATKFRALCTSPLLGNTSPIGNNLVWLGTERECP